MTIGIYKIINIVNDYYYIGSSKNIENRWKMHLSNLKNQNHINIFLQRAYNKYGLENFKLSIIDNCDGYSQEELYCLEQYYLDNIDEKCYNLSKVAAGGDKISYHPNREEIVKKIKQEVRKRYELMTEEDWVFFKKNRSKEKNGMYGKNHSEKTKKNISEKLINYYKFNDSYNFGKTFEELYGDEKAEKLKNKLSKLASMRSGDKNPFYGKSHSDETKKKLSEKHKDKYNGNQNTPIIIDGIFYKSLVEASRLLNIPITTIRWRVLSKNKKFINYKYGEKLND